MNNVVSFKATKKEKDLLLKGAGSGDLAGYVKGLVFDVYSDRSRAIALLKEKEEIDMAYRAAESMRITAAETIEQREASIANLKIELSESRSLVKMLERNAENGAIGISEEILKLIDRINFLRNENNNLCIEAQDVKSSLFGTRVALALSLASAVSLAVIHFYTYFTK